jgi:hypothetical protein
MSDPWTPGVFPPRYTDGSRPLRCFDHFAIGMKSSKRLRSSLQSIRVQYDTTSSPG